MKCDMQLAEIAEFSWQKSKLSVHNHWQQNFGKTATLCQQDQTVIWHVTPLIHLLMSEACKPVENFNKVWNDSDVNYTDNALPKQIDEIIATKSWNWNTHIHKNTYTHVFTRNTYYTYTHIRISPHADVVVTSNRWWHSYCYLLRCDTLCLGIQVQTFIWKCGTYVRNYTPSHPNNRLPEYPKTDAREYPNQIFQLSGLHNNIYNKNIW